MLARHDGAAQVDRVDAIKGFFGDVQQGLIASAYADTDIVVENVNSPPLLVRVRDGFGKADFFRDICLESDTVRSGLDDQAGGLLRRVEVAVYCKDPRTFLCETDRRCSCCSLRRNPVRSPTKPLPEQ